MDFCLQMLTCSPPKSEEEQEQIKTNNKIEKEISKSKQILRKEQKILLLGAGECGKSTFIKQMRIILGGGFPEEQYEYYKLVIHKNLLQIGASLANAMHTLNLPYHDQSLDNDAVVIADDFNENADPCLLNEKQIDIIRRIWADEGVKACYDRRREYHLLDSAQYFLERIDSLTKPGYRVNLQDILRSRVRTTGIIEEVFHVDNVNLKIIDVGGQRKERRKWIHSFEGVTSVIFLASLSEYDMVLFECKSRNRTEESIQLFSTILNYPWFKKSSLILFLNKKDLFEEKVLRSNLADYFAGYQGEPGDVEAARTFISSLYETCYMESSNDQSRELFRHITCATDTNNIRRVFENVKSTILRKNIEELNLG